MRHLVAERKANILETMHLIVFPELSLGCGGILLELSGDELKEEIQEGCKALRRLGQTADSVTLGEMSGKFERKRIIKGKPYQSPVGKYADMPQWRGGSGRYAFTKPALVLTISFSSTLRGNSDGQTNSSPDTIPAALSDGRCSVKATHRHPALWDPGGPVTMPSSFRSARRSAFPFEPQDPFSCGRA